MNDLTLLTAFLGWCTLINFGVLLLSTLMVVVAGDWAKGIHGRMFGIPTAQLDTLYFNYLAHYKLLFLVFNLVPYVALKLLA